MSEPLRPAGDRMDGELRELLRGRDPGPAPARLRIRVDRVTSDVAVASHHRAAWRIVAGLSAAAVLVIGIGIVAAMHLATGPTGGAPGSSSASPTPIPSVYGQWPALGPWPRTGPVPAIPLSDAAVGMISAALLLLAALLVAGLALDGIRDASRLVTPPDRWPRVPRTRRKRVARIGVGLVVVAALVAGVGATRLPGWTPLTYGSSFGTGTQALGSRGATDGGADEYYYPFKSGNRIELGISLRNDSDVPLTVTSLDAERFRSVQSGGPFVDSVELLLPPGETNSCEVFDSSMSQDLGGQCSQPFHPFELAAGTETVLLLELNLEVCPRAVSGPTPAPNAAADRAYLPTTGYVTVGILPLRYSILGVEREADVRLMDAIGLVFGSNEVTC